ncbi:MAG: GAF domain-containing protein [Gammaproteobacteria bacterium]|nr:MAG: GAF domain-containing protein [Gammaproteobacteria bacterium]RLA35593.1 MAG: GAF domain-containing protein [Gammaproteobacteria bacterium]
MVTVNYTLLTRQLEALVEDEADLLANSANLVGLLFTEIPDINWLGVYVLRGSELVLGPFQGKPACVRIPLGQGVCGTAAQRMESQLVADVNNFSGHISCDPASVSEVVVPLISAGQVIGVLDVDSPLRGRFSVDDQQGLELLCERFVQLLESKQTNLQNFI